MRTARGACQQYAGYIGASNQQHQADDNHEHREEGCDRTRYLLVQEIETCDARDSYLVRSLPAALRVYVVELLQNTSQAGSCNGNGHAFPHACVKLNVIVFGDGNVNLR